jgi:APA family basic amino acid/polyamine antiporter
MPNPAQPTIGGQVPRHSIWRQLIAVRPVEPGHASGAERLKQVLSVWALTAIGLGATIGSGIFVMTGQVAATHSGPAVTLSLLIAAFGSALAALCYAEFAAFLPVPGSAYSYTYATLGEALAWLIGWNLLLEYGMSASAVAVSWSGYVVDLLKDANIQLPAVLVNAPLAQDDAHNLIWTGDYINVPAMLIVGLMTALLYVGVGESARANTIMVVLKVAVIVIFVAAGVAYVHPGNWHPYIPPNTTGEFGHFGWSGVVQGAAIIFFSYVGFDTASTTALEARNPQRDLPRGIIAALLISTILYVAMSAVITGLVPYEHLNVDAPVAVALDAHRELASIGWLVKLGLLPPSMSACHPRFKTPHVATVWTGATAAVIAGVFPLDVLAEVISIGILMAFAVVCIGVLVLRKTRPEAHRPFRVPLAPVTCTLGALVCLALIFSLLLEPAIRLRLVIWTLLGVAIYLGYGYRHSKLRRSPPAIV